MTQTPREELEREVKIVARKGKQIEFLGKQVQIVGIPWEIVEDIGDHIIMIFSPIFELAVSSVGTGNQETAGTDISNISAIQAFDPQMFTKIGGNAKEAIKSLVTYGTDLEWDEIKSADFAAVVELATEVLKFNVGPSLTKNLSSGLNETLKAFGVNLTPVDRSTTSKQSLPDGDTPQPKSVD